MADKAAGRKLELAGYESWTLSGYAWRSRHVSSPLNGGAMRAVVGTDERGQYRPGVRSASAEGTATVFDVKPVRDKSEAMSKAQELFRSALIDHARQAAERTQRPGEMVDVRVEARALAIASGRDSVAAEKYGAGESRRDVPAPRRSR